VETSTQASFARPCEERFEVLYHDFSPILYSYCFRRLRDHHAAADVVQETLTRCWTRRAELDPQLLPRWLFRVARNLCLDLLSARRRVSATNADIDDGRHTPVEAASADPWKALFSALAQLGERDRELFRRHYLLGVGYEELAAELSATAGSVRVAVFRAKRLLLDNLAEMGVSNEEAG
jgi:RNA polymerase sigma factor (sigma-70 family)